MREIHRWQPAGALASKLGVTAEKVSREARKPSRRFPADIERRERKTNDAGSAAYIYRVHPDCNYNPTRSAGDDGPRLVIYPNQVEVHIGEGYRSAVATFWATAEDQTLDDAERRARIFLEALEAADE